MDTLDTAARKAVARNPRRWLILVVLCLSSLVLVVDNMVLTVAIPDIATDLHASSQQIQWIIDAYLLVFAGLLLTSGSLSDRFGRRLVMIIGLVLFGGASLLAAYASTPELLIAGRVVMGLGGVLIMPSTLSILITVFDDEERPKAIAAWSAVATVGMVAGPVLGGALLDHFWWGAVFVMNVPIAIVAVVAAVALMPESKGPWRKPDVPGMVLSVVGMVALVWGIIEVPQHGWSDRGTLIAFGIAAIALIAFVIRELTAASPMVPLKLFRDRSFTGSSFSLVLVTFANGGLVLVLTQFLQFVLGYSPMRTALAFTPMAVAILAFNGLGAGLVSKFGAKVVTVVGLVVVAGGFGALAMLDVDSGFWPVALATALLGAGAGLAMPAAIGALMSAVPAEDAGVGSALNDTIQQVGASMGVAVLGAVLAGTYSDEMPEWASAAARESIANVLGGGDAGLIGLARHAFSSAMSVTFTAGALSALAASMVAIVLMRNVKNVAGESDTGEGTPARTMNSSARAEGPKGSPAP
ncbi:EmrB/QacA subfamily drug resistance transporter [Nocardia transvalensis]|uniref:EmrB/QacA subfamily drug resistance transporter n=1 Tax=Nocardia transvalensis TaxID=37333 RepID=A0A7W9PCJ2_9NOCA|nr:MFS transporter [Nocardia transvalensis]MBB5913450.1 EmrB/QacA subfamily drug resistance transporter [Nocardia transvalensis]